MDSQRRQAPINKDDWGLHKKTILELYLDDDLTLGELADAMERNHGFIARYVKLRNVLLACLTSSFSSASQFELQLKEWGARKNLKIPEWQLILDRFDKIPPSTPRRIMISGRPCTEQKIKRARKSLKDQARLLPQRASRISTRGNGTLSNVPQAFIETEGLDGEWSLHNEDINDVEVSRPTPNNSLQAAPLEEELALPSPSTFFLQGAPSAQVELFDPGLPATELAGLSRSTSSLIPFNQAASFGLDISLNSGSLFPSSPNFDWNMLNMEPEPMAVHTLPNLSFVSNWLADLPSGRFELDLPPIHSNSSNPPFNSGGQSLVLSHRNEAQELLREIYENGQRPREDNPQSNQKMTIAAMRRLVDLFPNANQQNKHDHNSGMISTEEIFETNFHRLLLYSMVNGCVGLEDAPIEYIAIYLGRFENISLAFSRFLHTSSEHAAQSFAEKLFQAAIKSSENRVLSALLATRHVNANDNIRLLEGTTRTPIEHAISCGNPRGAIILLRAGANPHIMTTSIRAARRGHVDTLLRGVLSHAYVDKQCICSRSLPSRDWICLMDEFIKAGVRIDLGDIRWMFLLNPHDCMGLYKHTLSHCVSLQHQDLIKHGYLRIIAEVLEESQAIKFIQSIVAQCEILHDNACIHQHKQRLDDSLVVAARKGRYEIVRLLFPYAFLPTRILCASVRSGSDQLISYILSARPNINAVVPYNIRTTLPDHHRYNKDLTSPLAEAIRAENWDLVRIFEEAGALNLSHKPIQAGVAIEAAAKVGNFSYVKELLARCPYPSPISLKYALYSAVKLNCDDLVLVLLDAGASFADAEYSLSDDISSSLLIFALEHRNPYIVRALLNANMCGSGNMQALQTALEWGDKLIITDLLLAFDFPSRLKAAPMKLQIHPVLDSSSFNNHLESSSKDESVTVHEEILKDDDMFEFVLNSKLGTQALLTEYLMIALKDDDSHMFKRLLTLGADGSDEGVWMTAAKWRPEMLSILMKRPPDGRDTLTKGMRTNILHAAIINGASSAVKLLINSRIVDLFDTGLGHDRVTPLGSAIRMVRSNTNCGLDIVKMLLDAECDPNGIVSWKSYGNNSITVNQTPLLESIEADVIDLVQLLIEREASVNGDAVLGVRRTPLQKAVEIGNLEVVRLLLKRGADVNAKPAYARGGTALQFAALKGNCKLAAELIERGAYLYALPSKSHGRWPLVGAAEHGRLDMISFLWKAKNEFICLEKESGFEEKHCRRAMDLAVKNCHYACKDLISELSGYSYTKEPEEKVLDYPGTELPPFRHFTSSALSGF